MQIGGPITPEAAASAGWLSSELCLVATAATVAAIVAAGFVAFKSLYPRK
ncbi:uncharacterized protein AMSG_12059 [Thecamonas trahens ATCC 50062]|uniref:Uncharacterized protein n=1 Tax=Thecamonas trahens ATCC 50062 TaxID=461836 RepID=A0A0L0DG18_THETB|nr:hypothetical protein AMSG_12059 [Thecamonas trahens ATCC 50062]KNC51264.1 hypothetical protein AMSG_12059 [Thecamonas trahens ATCC 50062]|eukprot:XP_013756298.1 hypothetical protein AMSG_12059 [Thecamonas trahens ATCC 50062]